MDQPSDAAESKNVISKEVGDYLFQAFFGPVAEKIAIAFPNHWVMIFEAILGMLVKEHQGEQVDENAVIDDLVHRVEKDRNR